MRLINDEKMYLISVIFIKQRFNQPTFLSVGVYSPKINAWLESTKIKAADGCEIVKLSNNLPNDIFESIFFWN